MGKREIAMSTYERPTTTDGERVCVCVKPIHIAIEHSAADIEPANGDIHKTKKQKIVKETTEEKERNETTTTVHSTYTHIVLRATV